MSKGLEALNEVAEQFVEAFVLKEPTRTEKINEMLGTKQFKTIKNELKALEIIKEKIIPFTKFTMITKLGEKTYYTVGDNLCNDLYLSQEEFDLIKEVLL